VPCIVYKLCISSPPQLFRQNTIFCVTFLLMPILLRVAHIAGLRMELYCVTDSLVAASVYPMIAM
jgi:hypothetical protein